MPRFVPAANDEERILQRRVQDLAKAVQHTGKASFTGFLNDRQQQLAAAALHKLQWPHYAFEGGHSEAERCMLCLHSGQHPPFPLERLVVCPEAQAHSLTHRDYLGAILGLGIKRESVGDILVKGEMAEVFVQRQMAPFIAEQLCKVASVPVAAKLGVEPAPESTTRPPLEQTKSVPSLRLDAVLAAMLNASRAAAATRIKRGEVQVNHLLVESLHYTLEQGDVLSVRGVGKYRFCGTKGTSRKNRAIIKFLQY